MAGTGDKYSDEKYAGEFREDFIRNLRIDFFDDEEISAVLRDLDSLDSRIRQKVFALCHTLSHASSSLVPNALKRIKTASGLLPGRDLERWITHAYDILDRQGIGAFADYISGIDDEALRRFSTPEGLPLREIMAVLETYIRGISGRELKIAAARETYTDTSAIFLPAFVNRYEDRDRNYLIYKYCAALAWAQISQGTVTTDEDVLNRFLKEVPAEPDISAFFRMFPDERMAIDIFSILEAVRLETFLEKELPGLMREVKAVKRDFLNDRPLCPEQARKSAFVEGLYRLYLDGEPAEEFQNLTGDIPGDILMLKKNAGVEESMKLLGIMYDLAAGLAGDYQPVIFDPLLCTIRPQEVSLVLKAGRRARRQRLEGMITKLLNMPDFEQQKITLRRAGQQKLPESGKEYLLIKGRLIELDSEMREILQERGMSGGIIVKGADMGGAGSPMTLTDLMEEDEVIEESAGGVKYDEWDYKRGGYKKKWCTLREKNVHPGHDPFVEQTRKRYSGYIRVLRKRFELLRREPRLLRRQKDGDDFDLDAVIDAYSDSHAGLAPSEDLFMKYDRQQRSIAVLFLLDMSGSTKGWINEAEKESLVLMAEALETLGDRYAIFGFSGMKRSNCDFYRIKGFEEPYDGKVKRRISGISPKDYTRMGPPIRHSVKILKAVEERTRLFITLSDGRPEDYDAYKGDYAIEDTRRALTEAREQGIHPFCITIDREAGSYLRHMYGEVNYIVIDDVKKLPNRITEIYRRLTT
ncbi:MAG: hypothetical protein HZA17_09120 [Nitrospirae bacterium]|nr:hypothetical protein [Nitrospirota bacterium]